MINLIKKKINLLYKKLIINFFLLIYKKPTQKIKKDYSYKIFNIKIDKNPYKIFEFTKGRIFTDGNDTTAYVSKNNNKEAKQKG